MWAYPDGSQLEGQFGQGQAKSGTHTSGNGTEIYTGRYTTVLCIPQIR